LWLLHVLLDDHFYDGGKIKDEDRVGVEKCKLTQILLLGPKLMTSVGTHSIPSGGLEEEDGSWFDVVQPDSLRGKLV